MLFLILRAQTTHSTSIFSDYYHFILCKQKVAHSRYVDGNSLFMDIIIEVFLHLLDSSCGCSHRAFQQHLSQLTSHPIIQWGFACVRAANTPTVQRQTASFCPPCQTWRPRSCASRSPPLSVGSRDDLESEGLAHEIDFCSSLLLLSVPLNFRN